MLDRFRPERWPTVAPAPSLVVPARALHRRARAPQVRLYEAFFYGIVAVIGDQKLWPRCLALGNGSAAVSCKLQYREFYPGESHFFAANQVIEAIGRTVDHRLGRRATPWRMREGWLARLEQRASLPLEACTGVLFTHMDFYIAPRHVDRFSPDRVWRLGAGIPRPDLGPRLSRDGITVMPARRRAPPSIAISSIRAFEAARSELFVGRRCHSASQLARATPPHGFGYGAAETSLAAFTSIVNVSRHHWPGGGGEGLREHVAACAGWSDWYHVPIKLAGAFADLAKHYFPRRVFHEVAVPTILYHLARGDEEVQT